MLYEGEGVTNHNRISRCLFKLFIGADNKKKPLFSSLRVSSPGALAAGRKKGGELKTTSLEFEFRLQFPCGSPSTELPDFRQSARSGNERECKQTAQG